jgi:hypothetical protein
MAKKPIYIALIGSLLIHLIMLMRPLIFLPPEQALPDMVVTKLIAIDSVALSKDKPLISSDSEASISDSDNSGDKNASLQHAHQNSQGQAFVLPPSSKLIYASSVNGNSNQTADIIWRQNGAAYELNVSFYFFFVGDIIFNSVGQIDRYGISPHYYSEKVGRRERFVQFIRDDRQLFFSSNKSSQPMPDGVQDRFSVIFQLAALVAGNPDVDQEGVVRKIPIADVSSLDDWVFISRGDEEVVNEQSGKISLARHFIRLARSADDRRRLEIWLAKDDDWLPIKIRQTEPNRTVYELRLISKEPLNSILKQ